MVTSGKIKDRVSDTNWFIYVLKLESEKYYVGIAVDPKNRFLQHQEQGRSSASWCKKYKAEKILEVIDSGVKGMKDATLLEDIHALKYIKKYGYEHVRGGRYIGSELKVKKRSKRHLEQGYITIMHKLIEDVGITYDDAQKAYVYEYISDIKNTPWLLKGCICTHSKNVPLTV